MILFFRIRFLAKKVFMNRFYFPESKCVGCFKAMGKLIQFAAFDQIG